MAESLQDAGPVSLHYDLRVPFTLATWNTNFRRDIATQVAATLAHNPGIAVFQEVRAASLPELADRFAEAGLPHFATSSSSVHGYRMSRYVAVAGRFPFRDAAPVDGPAPETAVCLEIETPQGRFELVGVYVPSIARKDGVKVPMQHAMNARMTHAASRPHIICGDFNSPKAESSDGEVTLFFKPSRPAEYAGEHALMGGLLEHGLRDAFREANGYADPSPSWFWKNRGRTGGYRLDHIFVSPHFQVRRCWYDHAVREQGLSDHSLMCAEVELRRAGDIRESLAR
jgi:exonuclease III